MAAFNGIWFLLLMMWLPPSICASSKDNGGNLILMGKRASWNNGQQDVAGNERKGEFNDNAKDDDSDLGKIVNFARLEITKQSILPYKERIDDIIYINEEKHNSNLLYELKLGLNESHCSRYNVTCDPYFDPAFLPSEAEIIAPLKPSLRNGTDIEVRGSIPIRSKGFKITIQTNYETPAKGQLRINVKFSNNETQIQLEYFEEAWNLHSHWKGLLRPNEKFKIGIVCLSEHFKIFINEHFLSTFDHVLPFQDATHLSIFGNVSISSITNVGMYLPVDKYKPSKCVPFVAPLTASLAPGKSIQIKGFIPLHSESYAITIQTGRAIVPEKAQFRLLVDFSKGSNNITLSYFNGSWLGKQIVNTTLTPKQAFTMVITCGFDHFQIFIQGKKFATYDYQLPLEEATHLSIVGMVNITEVVGVGEVPKVPFLGPPVLRVCSMKVLYKIEEDEMWLNHLNCKKANRSLNPGK